MSQLIKRVRYSVVPAYLACSVGLSGLPLVVFAVPGETNSVNNGQNIQSGTYYNTTDGRTVFQNTSGSGLHLKSGDFVRGLEKDHLGNLTNNGGTLYFRAPGSVVRLDGNIDVSGLINGKGAYTGNGGRVFVDAGFLYQSGNIYANGVNGGLVQFNVGAATLAPGAGIFAKGFGNGNGQGGAGGQILINSAGVVDLQPGTVLDASGKVLGSYDTSVINIEGSIVNAQGIIRANGIARLDGVVESPVSALAVEIDVPPSSPEYQHEAPTVVNQSGSKGGTVRLVATGQSNTDCFDCVVDKTTAAENKPGVFTAEEAAALKSRNAELVDAHDGDIIIGDDALIEANSADGFAGFMPPGSGDYYRIAIDEPSDWVEGVSLDGQDGGTIMLAAVDDVINDGVMTANGGEGRYDYSAPGQGGDGGTIVVSAGNRIINNGTVEANGGDGGNNSGGTSGYDKNGSVETVQDGTKLESQSFNISGNAGTVNFGYKPDATALNGITIFFPKTQTLSGGSIPFGGGVLQIPTLYVKVTNSGGNAHVEVFQFGKLTPLTITKLNGNGTLANHGTKLVLSNNTPNTIAVAFDGTLAKDSQSVDVNLNLTFGLSKSGNNNQFNVNTQNFDLNNLAYSHDYTKIVKVPTVHDVTNTSTTVYGQSGANGGTGGLIAFSYSDSFLNSGIIKANGGRGGIGGFAQATAISDSVNYGLANATAKAYGGWGGNGGHGGLIVFSGPDDPTNTGTISADGGDGGRSGDANAYALAASINLTENRGWALTDANAQADANRGGAGGSAGLIVTPTGLPVGGYYFSRAGAKGQAGFAEAYAVALGIDSAKSYAKAIGRDGSISKAMSLSFDVPSSSNFAEYNQFTDKAALRNALGITNESIFWKDPAALKSILLGTKSTNNKTSITDVASALSLNGSPTYTDWWSTFPDYAKASSDLSIIVDPTKSNVHHFAATQNNELLAHNENLILLSRNGGQWWLSERLDDAIIRTVTSPNGSEWLPENDFSNLFIASIDGTPLILDQNLFNDWGLNWSSYNTMTVSNANGAIINPYGSIWAIGAEFDGYYPYNEAVGGGHLSWLADGPIINGYGDVEAREFDGYYNEAVIATVGQATGGSINLVSNNRSIINRGIIGQIATGRDSHYNDVSSSGGSILLTAGRSIRNSGLIGGFGLDNYGAGTTIHLQAGRNINNRGQILADAGYGFYGLPYFGGGYSEKSVKPLAFDADYGWSPVPIFGGIITAKAGKNAINQGFVSASAYDSFISVARDVEVPTFIGNGYGGNILWHGGNVSTNGRPGGESYGYIGANGSAFGGTILLTAGGNDKGGLKSGSYDGLSITNYTMEPLFNPTQRKFVDTNVGESAWNFGSIETFGGIQDGTIVLAGNQQAGAGLFATFNGIPTGADVNALFSQAQGNGGTLRLVAGAGAVESVLCNIQLPRFSPVPPDGGTPGAPGASSNLLVNTDGQAGLFQYQRPVTDAKLPAPATLLLAFQDPAMFLASGYTPVAEEILALSLEEYKRALALGENSGEAKNRALAFLKEAGVDSETAQALLEMIEQGSLTADPKVKSFLGELSHKPATGPSTQVTQ